MNPRCHELENRIKDLELELSNLKSNKYAETLFWQGIEKSIPSGISVIDDTGKQVYVNQSFCNLVGWEEQELLEKYPPYLYWSEAEIENIKTTFQKTLKGKVPKEGFELLFCNKSEKLIPVRVIISSFTIDNNRTFWLANVIDITGERQAELVIQQQNSKLIELNATKDKLFSIIAHDLKSPLSGFLLLMELMLTNIEKYSLNEIKGHNKALHESARNVYELLESLLDWSRMQRGLIEFHPDVIVLSFLIKRNIKVLSVFARVKDIEIVNLVSDSLQIRADASMVNTIIRNLISNAIKFTPKGGKVVVSAEEKDDKLLLSVRDSGIGMDKNIVDNLFGANPAEPRIGTNFEISTGLGLIICKEFIIKHSGEIWVESEVGRGSTFYFTLPKVN
ncbi:MAG: PAS domain-containing sensor histidine kinase [Leptospiraceae bacterium]|nr:PAS domain S-box protein [Leptospiraceae bacterium]MCP5496836.1 PAS domain-containing sensor histidine kinase [Leptospiraceae bacterium]